MKISRYFSRHEVACKCGCGFDTMDVMTIRLADEIREHTGKPITCSSGCRCVAYNINEDGGKKSQHLFGRAMDLHVADPEEVYNWINAKYPARYGFGLYDWGVHIDARTNGPARWDRRTS